MNLITFVCLLPAFSSPTEPVSGGPQVKWSAPSSFVTGQPYKVSIEITAPADGTTVANWLLTPAAFTLDGKALAKREEGGTLDLPAGFKLSGELDLGAYLKPTGSFKLGYASEVNDTKPVEVRVIDAAPAGLDFMKMPVEDLGKYHVILHTNRGDIEVKFWPDVAPNHVRNYLDLSYTGFYDGTTFHRVIPGFMIQGGDPTGTGTGDGPRQLQAEFQTVRKHVPGVLSMARSQDPNSASCQFFIMHANSPHLDGQYSAFGETVSGLDVVDLIVKSPKGPGDKPKEPQTILKAIVIKAQ